MKSENAEKLFKRHKDLFGTYIHWLDEKEYEPWEDFEKWMKDFCERVPGCEFVSAHKRPFGFKFKADGKKWYFSTNNSGSTLKEIRVKIAKVKCSRCGKVMPKDDWHSHICEGMRNLSDLPFDILTKLVKKEITEKEAWIEADKSDKKQ